MHARFIAITALFTTTVALAACSPLALLDLAVPKSGYRRNADLAYAPDERHRLDVYVPAAPEGAEPRPVIVFFYGGGWETGRRERYRFVGQALTSQGFVAVVPDYRVYPQGVFPDFVVDGAKAVRWVTEHIARFGGDPQRVFVMGHSAGAHIAAMLALDRRYLKQVGVARAPLRGMIGLAGPYDFLPLQTERLKMIFGPEPQRWRTQPINFVDGRNPPLLLVTGGQDTTVLPHNTHSLATKVRGHGGVVTVIEYPRVGHADLLTRLAAPFRGNGELLRAIAAFVREH